VLAVKSEVLNRQFQTPCIEIPIIRIGSSKILLQKYIKYSRNAIPVPKVSVTVISH
jgi:hypothetical protein